MNQLYLNDNLLIEEIVDECRASHKSETITRNLLVYIEDLINRLENRCDKSSFPELMQVWDLVASFIEESMKTVANNKGTDLFRELKRLIKRRLSTFSTSCDESDDFL